VEFSIVQWAATLIASRTGADTAQATLLAGLFLGGMFVGGWRRAPGSAAAVASVAGRDLRVARPGRRHRHVAGDGPLLAGLAIFVAGTGVAGLYPLGVAGALSTAPDRLALAARA
jgi:hypothetical protein